jgi:hypothetical protein
MEKRWLIKPFTLSIAILFIGISFQPVFAIETKKSNNQSGCNKSYIDPNINLKKINLPILKRSLNYFRNSDHFDFEIGKILKEIISLIEIKGDVNSKDIENILFNNKIVSIDVYTKCNISGISNPGYAFTIPFLLPEFLFFLIRWWIPIFIGIGGFLKWVAFYGTPITDIKISVNSTNYTSPHKGYAFGFFGVGHVWQGSGIPEEGPFWLSISGRALIAFVRT